MNVDEAMRSVVRSAEWELSIVYLHFIIYVVCGFALVLGHAWWWYPVAGIWGLTVAIGAARSIRRRTAT